MSFLSLPTGFPRAFVLTGLLAANAGAQNVPVPLIVPFEKSQTPPTQTIVAEEAIGLMPSPDQPGQELAAVFPTEDTSLLIGPLPGETELIPYEASLSASESNADLPAMEDAIIAETEDTRGSWLVSGLDRPFGESSLLPVITDGFDSPSYLLSPTNAGGTDLEIAALTSLIYVSNVRRSGTVPSGSDKDDWILTVTPGVFYGWKSGHWTGDVAARVSYDYYANNDGMGGLGYSLATGVRYDGGRWQVGAKLGSALTNGGNRYLGDYTEQLQYSSSISASYLISPKTLLDGSLSYRLSEPESGGGQRTESLEAIFSALWKYSRLLEFGPGFRYRWESNETADDRVTVGPLLRTRYRLTGKTALDSDLGINFFDMDGSGGDSEVAPFARLGIHYQMSRIWSFDFSLGNDSVADEAGGYRDMFQIRAGVSRPIRRANWRMGVGYEKIERSGAALNIGDTTSFSVDTALTMKVFGDKADAELFVRWREQQEDDGGAVGDWSGTQVGLSLGAKF